MERSWYWRVALIVGVALLSVYQLVPSWYYFKLPPDVRNGEAYDQSVPRWAPAAKHHLNLGLDLQGGIHLAMGVDVDRAVKAKVARRADEIADFLKTKDVAFTDARTTDGGRRIEVKGPDADKIRKTVLDAYDAEMYSPGGAPDGGVGFAFKDQVLREFQGKAVEQAEKAIRNRVDKWGVTEPDIKRKANAQIQIQLPGFKDPGKAKELLGRTAQLEFKITDDESPALDPLRSTVPQCPGGRAGLQMPLPEAGCWTAETIELPNGGSRAVTMLVANTRPELEKLIDEKANPLLDPSKNVVGIGEGTIAQQGGFQAKYYRTYLLRAKTELTGDYIADAGVGVDNSDPLQQGRPVVTFKMTAQGAGLMEKLTGDNMRPPDGDRPRRQGRDRAVHPGAHLLERPDHPRLRHEPPAPVRGGERHRPRPQGGRAPGPGHHLRGAHRRRDPRAGARAQGHRRRARGASSRCSCSWCSTTARRASSPTWRSC